MESFFELRDIKVDSETYDGMMLLVLSDKGTLGHVARHVTA